MADIVIRDVPIEVLAVIDAKARRVGLSRSEYLRRVLKRESLIGIYPVSLERLRQFAQLTQDLDDPEVMSDAWS
ncbi:antitoxin [Candidatus Poriferisocius sp.]|uniref:type II toxin-antitoxin system VapB family antitoxin n=1 Tax=Candidatus Poriferisocius sp. TaxID=3101276 RepID=UPI003B5ABD92